MNVRELIELLRQEDPDLEVQVPSSDLACTTADEVWVHQERRGPDLVNVVVIDFSDRGL